MLLRRVAVCAAQVGDGDKAVLVDAVAVCPPVLLPIAALLQLDMPRRAPPVALNVHAWFAQGHFLSLLSRFCGFRSSVMASLLSLLPDIGSQTLNTFASHHFGQLHDD